MRLKLIKIKCYYSLGPFFPKFEFNTGVWFSCTGVCFKTVFCAGCTGTITEFPLGQTHLQCFLQWCLQCLWQTQTFCPGLIENKFPEIATAEINANNIFFDMLFSI